PTFAHRSGDALTIVVLLVRVPDTNRERRVSIQAHPVIEAQDQPVSKGETLGGEAHQGDRRSPVGADGCHHGVFTAGAYDGRYDVPEKENVRQSSVFEVEPINRGAVAIGGIRRRAGGPRPRQQSGDVAWRQG